MCTLTWTTTADGHDVLFSRDEQLSRGEALPPRLWDGDGARFVAPIDPDGGGSWIAVNAAGWTLCVLNQYGAVAAPECAEAPTSRGRLITRLAGEQSAGALRRGLAGLLERPVRPFMLVAFPASGEPLAWRWDGRELTEAGALQAPITTSSVRAAEVERLRRRAFARHVGRAPEADRDALFAFHRSACGERPWAGVAMRRGDAETVSLTHVEVTSAGRRMHYYPGHPADHPRARPLSCSLPVTGDPVTAPNPLWPAGAAAS